MNIEHDHIDRLDQLLLTQLNQNKATHTPFFFLKEKIKHH